MKILIGTIIVLCVIAWCVYQFLPGIIVGIIQKGLYKDGKPINSYEPFGKPDRRVKENGELYVTEIKYGEKYPNSYLDITYPTEDTSIDRPTVIYFHGGGFFGGDKSWGDPMAIDDDANRLFGEIVGNGYNFVNVNYALVPEYHFPVPLIQMNEAINFLVENQEQYGLNMDKVVIFGQSAGAVLTAQYGALLSNGDYRKELNIYPKITTNHVKALIIDDAPLRPEKYNFALWVLMANYMGNSNIRSKQARQANAYLYIKETVPPCFMTAGNTDGFPWDMGALSEKLTNMGVENEYYFRDRSYGDLPHGYLNMVKENAYARECFDHIIAFMNKYCFGHE